MVDKYAYRSATIAKRESGIYVEPKLYECKRIKKQITTVYLILPVYRKLQMK